MIMTAIIFFPISGNLESFRSMADRFGVSKGSFHLRIKRVSSAIVKDVMPTVIQWPTEGKVRDTAQQFGNFSQFQHVIGAVDGSHIPIKAPKQFSHAYYNRKRFHSLVLLAVCDANLCFTYVWTGNPGSTHDATVLRSSEIFRNADELIPPGYYLLGDSAFPLLGWLLTPFRDLGHLNPQQKLFNKAHSKTRQVIERAFGLLKCRFRRLLRLDAADMNIIVDTILSACTLHTICINEGDDIQDELLEDDNDVDDQGSLCNQGHQLAGVRLRQEIMQQLVNI